jgi:protein CpxP
MKKMILVALLAIGVSAVSFAQGPMRSPEEQVAALKTSLTLDDAQVAKVTAIYQARAKTMDSIRNNATGNDMQAMFAKIVPIYTVANDKVKAILTAEQNVIFQKQVDAQNERFKQIQQGQN